MRTIYILMCMLLSTVFARAGSLAVDDFSLNAGMSQTVAVKLSTSGDYSAFMFDVSLPDGGSVTAVQRGAALTESHSVSVSELGDGRFRVIGFSGSNALGQASGTLVTLTIAADDRMADGTYEMTISNVMLTPADVENVQDYEIDGCTANFTVSALATKTSTPAITFSNGVVSISTATQGAAIYYTLDGTTPTRNSAMYSAPITLSKNCTVKAYAVKSGMAGSETAEYKVDYFLAATPVITIEDHIVTITTITEGAEIYYNTEGLNPATNGLKYSAPFSVTKNCTVKAIARHADFKDSEVAEVAETAFITAAPTITFKNNVMTLASTTKNAKIYYTLDGTEPTVESLYYQNNVTLYGNKEVRAIAILDGYTQSETAVARLDYFKVASPVISVKSGLCEMSCGTADSKIYYQLAEKPDADFDLSTATLYTESFLITENCFVQAIAVRDEYNNSPMVVQGVYSYGNIVTLTDIALTGEEEGDIFISMENRNAFTAVQMDVRLPAGLKPISAVMSTERTDGHSMSYNIDEATNTVKLLLFSGNNNNLQGNDGKLFALHVLCDNSARSGDYDIIATNIVATTADGIDYFLDEAKSTFSKDTYAQTAAKPVIEVNEDHVSIVTTTAGATIYYTLDGTYPTTQSLAYSSMFVLDRNTTIRAIAVCPGMNFSEMSERVVNTLQVATPVLKMQGNNAFNLSCKTTGATIHYTLDGSEPTEDSPVYESLVVLTDNCTVRVKAWKEGLLPSAELVKQIQSLGQYIYANNVYLPLKGDEVNVPVYLSSTQEYTAWQMDIKLPQDVVLSNITIGASDGHSLAYSLMPNGTYRVIAYSGSNNILPTSNLYTMTIHADENAVAADAEIAVQNIIMTRKDGSDCEIGDNTINVTLSALSLNMADDDYEALKTLYTALGGDNWTDKWDISSPQIIAENWPGVTFEEDRVVAINLQSQGLSGTLPLEVFSLKALQNLDLSRNNLTGDLSTIFQNASVLGCGSTLVSLNLSNNKLEGDVYPLAVALPKLQSLYLGTNRLSEVSHSLPTSITLLDLSYQQIDFDEAYTLPGLLYEGESALPTLVCYNHATQTFNAPNLTLKNGVNSGWEAQLYYTSGQLACQFSGKLNEYDQPTGAGVQAVSNNALSYGSSFVFRLNYEMGDANFDDNVNIQDFQTILNYSYRIYPDQKRLFNRAASNLYDDATVNIQDLVLLIDMLNGVTITNNAPSMRINEHKTNDTSALLYIDGTNIVLDSSQPIAAMQLSLSGVDASAITWTLGQYGFAATAKNCGRNTNAVIYSMMRNELPAGRTVIGKIRGEWPEAAVTNALGADINANAILIGIDNTTGINAVEADKRGSGVRYNISGQRVNAAFKGIVIENGRKTVK